MSECSFAYRWAMTQSTQRGIVRLGQSYAQRRTRPVSIGDHASTADKGNSVGVNEQPDCNNAEVGRCFLRLAQLDNGAFDRLSRYETALWRHLCQVLFTLDSLRRR